MFGPHLVLEGYECENKNALNDESTMLNILTELPARINMTPIMSPKIIYYDGGEIPDDYGVSGFTIIAESHIALHTFPHKGFFTLDIFSCNEFDIQVAIKYILDIYSPKRYEHKVFDRGREFPRSMSRATEIVNTEREAISVS